MNKIIAVQKDVIEDEVSISSVWEFNYPVVDCVTTFAKSQIDMPDSAYLLNKDLIKGEL